MPIHYVIPLQHAWERMKTMLFRPFSLELWLVLGFTAWLARLWDNAGGGIGNGWRNKIDLHDGGQYFFRGDLHQWHAGDFDWWGLGGLGAGIILMLILFGIAFAVLVAWLSSRGAFMFLDNVAQRRAKVTEPWREYAREADTLFLWRIAAQIVAGALALACVLPALFMIVPLSAGGLWRGLGAFGTVMLALVGIGLGIAVAVVNLWTDQFVVPLMYKRRLNVLEGWRVFLPLVHAHFGPLFLFALFYLVLAIGVVLAAMVAGLVTCCVGWVVLVIPYVGTVILLPVYVTGRALGPEFLAQFGDEYRLWHAPEAAAPEAPGA